MVARNRFRLDEMLMTPSHHHLLHAYEYEHIDEWLGVRPDIALLIRTKFIEEEREGGEAYLTAHFHVLVGNIPRLWYV